MTRPKPIATRLACATSLAFFLFARTDHLQPRAFATLLLVCALLPAFGVWADWIRLERPSWDDAFFSGATLAGALVVGIAPNAAMVLWHPVLLAVALAFGLRPRVVSGTIVEIDRTRLTLALERGRLSIAREAHAALGPRTALLLEEGAPLALTTTLAERAQDAGPFRSARVLDHGSIQDVGSSPAELFQRRRRRAWRAIAMVAASATVGWGVALAHVPLIGCAHP